MLLIDSVFDVTLLTYVNMAKMIKYFMYYGLEKDHILYFYKILLLQ